MRRFVAIIINTLAKMIFPERCIRCDTRGSALCAPCLKGIPLADPTGDDAVYGVFDYGNKTVQKTIHDAKYYRKSEALLALAGASAPYISEYISDYLQSLSAETIVLVPIPQHKQKDRARGFNQSLLIARALTHSIEGAVVQTILKKTRATKPQAHTQGKRERLENLVGSMTARRDIDPHKLYIIVDDVTTTGATVLEAMRALKHVGIRKVLAVALSHGYAKK